MIRLPYDECVIHIQDTGDIWLEQIKGNIKSTKKVLPETFLDCVKGSIRTGLIESGVLPKGCISYSGGDKDTKFVCMEFMEDRCDIEYEKTKYSNFPIPRLVFGFLLAGERIQSIRLGVVDRGTLSPKSKMYVYPMCQVSICV